MHAMIFRFTFCVRRRKNAVLIRIGVAIVWDKVDCHGRMDGSWDAYLASPTYFLQGRMISSPTWQRRQREPEIKIIKRTP